MSCFVSAHWDVKDFKADVAAAQPSPDDTRSAPMAYLSSFPKQHKYPIQEQ